MKSKNRKPSLVPNFYTTYSEHEDSAFKSSPSLARSPNSGCNMTVLCRKIIRI